MVETQQAKKFLPFDKDKLEIMADGDIRLLGTKCGVCKSVALGKHPACLKCHSRDIETITLTRSGVLQNYSIVHLKPSAEWKGPVPYVLGEVKTPEGPVITTYIVGLNNLKEAKVGLKVKLGLSKADQDEQGNDIMVYVWNPV